MIDDSIILEIKDLTKVYDSNKESQIILKQVNLKVKKNEFLCILGQSGCGKTTLLRCIAGFENYSGNILIDGKERKTPGVDRIMVFQEFNQLFPWKTVEKNIQYPLKLQGFYKKNEVKKRSQEALNKVKLLDYAQYYPYQLSGGMKQRVAIAKALALKPKIILMDEPFAALDAMTRNKLQEELLTISIKEKCTIVFITHNIQEAIILGTRIIVLGKKGNILIDQQNLLKKPITPATEGYGIMWEKLHEVLYKNEVK